MVCPVCQTNQTYFWAKVKHQSSLLSIRKCSNCLCLFQFPLPAAPDDYYDESYYAGTAEFGYHDERTQFEAKNHVYQARLKQIARYVPRGTFLDVGCSFGGFVQAASDRYRALGLDVSSFAVQAGNKWAKESQPLAKGFAGLFVGTLSKLPKSAAFKKETFSVITLVEVAEHLAKPLAEFRAAYELLAPGGLLLIQTANFAGWQAISQGASYHYFMPGHLTYFNATALKQALTKIGFRKFKEFIPVDFSLMAKLKKSRHNFRGILDYLKWFRIAWYHISSYLPKKGRPRTSSYVLYAFK